MCVLNVEFQEAEPSRVMHLGCVVDRGRIERLRYDTFSCLGRVSSGSGESGWPKRLVTRLHGGSFRLRKMAERRACWWIRDMLN